MIPWKRRNMEWKMRISCQEHFTFISEMRRLRFEAIRHCYAHFYPLSACGCKCIELLTISHILFAVCKISFYATKIE